MALKQTLHRHLWQRLPYQWRRSALFHASSLLAPRPTASAIPKPPVILAGPLRTASGLGQAARLCHDALKAAAEYPVFGVDLTSVLMQPKDVEFAFADGRDHRGAGTIILHVNSPHVPHAMLSLGQRILHEKYVIGYWAWELPRMPWDWRHGVPFVHEVWVPSNFTAAAVEPIVAPRPVRVVPLPVSISSSPSGVVDRHPSRPFTVLTFFNAKSSIARKNPHAAIAAFRQAFGSDPGTRLIVKAMHLDTVPQAAHIRSFCSAPNIALIEGVMDVAALDALYAQADLVLSLHRSEGFGLTLAEAMLRGLPVVATDWSGSVDFVTEACGIPVPFRLVPAEDPQRSYHYPEMRWAEPDVAAAAAALVALRADPDHRRRLGAAAAAFAIANWGIENYAGSVRRALGGQERTRIERQPSSGNQWTKS